MLSLLDRAWRTVATAFCFACFGLGGLLLRLAVFPLIALAVHEQRLRVALARALIRHSMRAFVWLMRTVGVISVEVHGAERLERSGLLVLANHPSLIDVVLLIALVPDHNCVVKAALRRNPFMRGPVETADFITNDGGPALVDEAIASVRGGSNLIIFPEGTRTPVQGEGPRWQRGAANIAVRGGLPVTPVLIRSEPPMLRKGERWWQVPVRRAHYRLEVQGDIDTAAVTASAPSDAQAARLFNDHLRNYFSHELNRPARA
ncbi:lysophospholipid acyltransferase family protein [Rivibacter subsaxonicus]|uniref:1-acyl-sn-glycerol-3-phosphate acyltransferase n=1 Tax=Rivibacter subsaxonicus TaxID=457575 RepID=A0A4Q7W1A2_9BURK|nr:1-acyl-sn-glycerol-3-phosphate acyltransferase [Rivibacter subsaxonicus]RZU03001.1 1-acyl-sn-glycerol-3-phosphate acyltransferase [Rivibacter subsaxonicus]